MTPNEVSTQQPASRFEFVVQKLGSDGLSSWFKAIFLLLALFYLLGLAWIGVGPINAFETDLFIELDGAWRVYSGQIPHRDFYLALGPLEYMISGLGMVLTKATPSGVIAGNIVFAVVTGIWGWLLVRKRMPVLPALLVVAWLLLMGTCPTPLGYPAYKITVAKLYNRHGYVLLSLILIECAFPLEAFSLKALRTSQDSVWRGVSSGAALVMLGFLKLNFFGAAVLLLSVSLCWQWRDRKRLIGLLLGAAMAFLCFLAFLHFALMPFLHDMALATRSRATTLSLRRSFLRGLADSDSPAMAMIVVTAVSLALFRKNTAVRISRYRICVLGAVVFLCGLLLRITDYDESDIPFATLWILLLLGSLAMVYSASREKFTMLLVGAMCLPLLYPDFSRSVKSFGYLASAKESEGKSRLTIHDATMAKVRFYEWPGGNGQVYIASINDGLALLKEFSGPQDRILALGENNPFPYILRRQPMSGGSPWFQLGINISPQHLPDAPRVFGNSTILMISKARDGNDENARKLADAYSTFIQEHYREVAHSDLWTIYRRKSDGSVSAAQD